MIFAFGYKKKHPDSDPSRSLQTFNTAFKNLNSQKNNFHIGNTFCQINYVFFLKI